MFSNVIVQAPAKSVCRVSPLGPLESLFLIFYLIGGVGGGGTVGNLEMQLYSFSSCHKLVNPFAQNATHHSLKTTSENILSRVNSCAHKPSLKPEIKNPTLSCICLPKKTELGYCHSTQFHNDGTLLGLGFLHLKLASASSCTDWAFIRFSINMAQAVVYPVLHNILQHQTERCTS